MFWKPGYHAPSNSPFFLTLLNILTAFLSGTFCFFSTDLRGRKVRKSLCIEDIESQRTLFLMLVSGGFSSLSSFSTPA